MFIAKYQYRNCITNKNCIHVNNNNNNNLFSFTRFTDNDICKYVRGFTSVVVPPILYVIVLLSKEG